MIQQAWSDYYETFDIKWTRGIPLDEYFIKPHKLNEDANFYMVSGIYNGVPKLFYIGMVYQQDVKTRLGQQDHLKKWKYLRKNYSRHCLIVSIGCIEASSRKNKTERMIKSIEKLLIFCNDNDHFMNLKSTSDIIFPKQAKITNFGSFKPLYKKCFWGAFVQ